MTNFKETMSLAKLSIDLFNDYYDLNVTNELFYDNVIREIKKRLNNHNISSGDNIGEYKVDENIYLFVYETSTSTSWKNFIKKQFDINLSLKNLTNSYLFIFNVNNSLYTLTAGLANNIIDIYKDKSFGLRILTKLFNEDDSVIKKKVESLIAENRSSNSATFRINTSFDSEILITSIKRNIIVETNEVILEKMGIIEKQEDGSIDRVILNIKFGNNIEINKRLTFEEIKKIINKIDYIDNNEDIIFALDNITLAEKKNFTQAEIKNKLITKIEEYIDNLSIPYTEVINFDNVTLYNKYNNVVDEENFKKIKTFEELNIFIKDKLLNENTKSVLDYYFKENSKDDKIRLYDLLEVELDYKNHQFYLIDGSFYTFDKAYDKFYEERYIKLFNDSQEYVTEDFIYKSLNEDIKDGKSEKDFNESLKSQENIIFADKQQYKRIELADAISIKSNEIIFIHNKTKFNGSGIRDVTSQILTSANYLRGFLNNKEKEKDSFDAYIEKLKEKNETKDELINKFYNMLKEENTKITYIAAFVDKTNLIITSNYIKYLLEFTKTELNNFNFYIY